jgi:hypothetical protein
LLAKIGQVGGGKSQQAAIDGIVISAQRAARVGDDARRGGEGGNDARHGHVPFGHACIGDCGDHAARLKLRIGGDIGDARHRASRNARFIQKRLHRGEGARRHPGTDDLIQRRHIGDARAIIHEARIVGQAWHAHRAGEAAKNIFPIAADGDPFLVAGAIDIGGRRAQERIAAALAHHAAMQHQALPVSEQAIPPQTRLVAARQDEVGGLARSLVRLERDGLEKLGELRTLLETSNAVVGSLDPYAVVGTIIREARRLVDVQAAAVLVPDEHDVLRVLVSDGHSERFNAALSLSPENMHSTAVLALHDRQPVQRLIDDTWPSIAYLAAIKGYASTLLQEDVSWQLADQRHFLATISGEADRLAQLVSNLLDLSRQETGLLLLDRAPSPVADLAQQTLARLSYPEVTLHVALPADLPLVNVDATRIEVVLRNLIANAVTYGAHAVRISAVPQDDALVIAIADDGPGIAPDELPFIFERFYRTRHGRQLHAGGTGLGLAICKAFIAAHGGTIWATSEGHGTTIWFTLPLAVPDVAVPTSKRLNTGRQPS